MKSINHILVLGLLSVMLVYLPVDLSIGIESNQNIQPRIFELNRDFETPKINDSILFTVLLENIDSEVVTNVTLDINQRDLITRYVMNFVNNVTYEYSYFLNSSGSIQYQAFLFIDESLVDTSPMKMFQIEDTSNGKTVLMSYNQSHEFSKGNFSIATPDDDLNLTLEINGPITLLINNLTKDELNLPGNIIPVSNAYNIQVNNSKAISKAKLQMRYQSELIDELGINPQLLNLYTREEYHWESVNIEINEEVHRITHQTTHFSQWVIAASLPTLKFIDTAVEYSTIKGEYLDLPIILKNFGSYAAENISLRLIKPPGLLLNNLSNILDIDRIDPLEQQSFLWQFLVDSTGEFNLVILCGSDNADGDILNIRIIVNTAAVGITSTTNSQTPIFIPIQVAIVLISISLYYKRQKHADSE